MDLFNIVPDTYKPAYNPLKEIADNLDIYEQLKIALQIRDRQTLNYLLSDLNKAYYWQSKQDFIEKYVSTCERLASKEQIFITVLKGGCKAGKNGLNTCGFSSNTGMSVSVNTVCNNKPLWQFNLLYDLDNQGKIILKKCNVFDISTKEIS